MTFNINPISNRSIILLVLHSICVVSVRIAEPAPSSFLTQYCCSFSCICSDSTETEEPRTATFSTIDKQKLIEKVGKSDSLKGDVAIQAIEDLRDKNKKLIVLYAQGCYNPPHKAHTESMKTAREYILKEHAGEEVEVIGVFVLADDEKIRTKMSEKGGPKDCFPMECRTKMMSLGCDEDKDNWLYVLKGHDELSKIGELVERLKKDNLAACYELNGADHYNGKTDLKSAGYAIESDEESIKVLFKNAGYTIECVRDVIYLARDEELGCSSTKVREWLHSDKEEDLNSLKEHVFLEVLKYIQENSTGILKDQKIHQKINQLSTKKQKINTPRFLHVLSWGFGTIIFLLALSIYYLN